MSSALTLAQPARLQQDIRKSRFLAQAEPVADPAATLDVIARLSDPLATHNCWAYRIGQHYRFADDGEPAGTAGRPILQAIEGQGVDRVIVVVTRWYGGIKLGAGGLARAYGGCAAECLRLADKLPIVDLIEIRVHCEYAELAALHARLREHAAVKFGEHFDNGRAQMHLRLPRANADAFADFVRDLTRGRGTIDGPP